MADPIGLLSLGLDGAGKLLKVKERVRRRKAALLELSAQLNEAHKLLVDEGHPTEDSMIYEAVLVTPMNAALALLERERKRNGLSASFSKYVRASGEIEAAERLALVLKTAPSEIQARCVARDARAMRINIEFLRAHHEPPATGNHTGAVTITISSLLLFTCGR